MPPFVLFDDVTNNHSILLQHFVQQHILSPSELNNIDTLLQQGWSKDWHCALFIDYEFGIPLQQLPNNHQGYLKIYWFKHKTQLTNPTTWLQQHGGNEPAGLSTANYSEDFNQYQQHIHAIHEAIKRGDTYQINHTIRLYATSYGNPIKLYHRLRQNVPYATLAQHPNKDWTLCFSPELFLKIHSNGTIETEPMKGTAPILNDGQDQQRAKTLKNDPKNRAENTMIVDLLRNDLGKIANTGSVQVPKPFEVNPFGSVWQMTSKITAKLKPQTTVAHIFQAAFPCGSITGAPKRKSMEIIQQLEPTPRHLYTGSIGFIEAAPNTTLGFSGCLNVAIRTLELSFQQEHSYQAKYGVGSGIVIDSQANDEYHECGWKAKFITQLPAEIGIFETMLAENRQIALWHAHQNRLQQSAYALNIPLSINQIEQQLQQTLKQLATSQKYRIKLSLSPSGSLNIETHSYQAPDYLNVIISPTRLSNHNPLRHHKTTHRAIFDKAWQQAQQQQAFDALFFNQQGYLLEGGRSAVMIQLNQQWLTPAKDLDILDSIARQQILHTGQVKEAYITLYMLTQATQIKLGNALHGWFPVKLIN